MTKTKTTDFRIDWDVLKLTEEEENIENAFAGQQPLSGKEFEERKKELIQQARNSYAQRTKKVSLRMKVTDLETLKNFAVEH